MIFAPISWDDGDDDDSGDDDNDDDDDANSNRATNMEICFLEKQTNKKTDKN